MRECPKCGFLDPPYWHRHRWRIDVDITHLDDFKMLYPEMGKQFDKGHEIVTDKTSAYIIGGKDRTHVFRVWIKLYEIAGKRAFQGMPSERVNHTKDIFQKKIGDFPFAP